MGETHDDWHEWRHGTDKRLDTIEHRLDGIVHRLDGIDHELRMIRWVVGFVVATQVVLIGSQVAVMQTLASLR